MAHVRRDDAGAGTLRISSRTLGDILREFPGIRIAACKIDVEGHEAAVLAGASAMLAAGIIDAVIFERHFVRTLTTTPVIYLFHRNGYEIRRIEKGMWRVVYNHPRARPVTRQTPDYVVVRRGASP